MALIKINGKRSRRSSKDSGCALGRERVISCSINMEKVGGRGGREEGDPSNPVDILAISSPHPSQDRPLLSEMDPNKLVQEQPKLCY